MRLVSRMVHFNLIDGEKSSLTSGKAILILLDSLKFAPSFGFLNAILI